MFKDIFFNLNCTWIGSRLNKLVFSVVSLSLANIKDIDLSTETAYVVWFQKEKDKSNTKKRTCLFSVH